MKTLIMMIGLLTAATNVDAEEPTVEARLSPASVALGEDAELQITIKGQSARRPSLPAVDGLHIVPSGQSQQTTMFNGVVQSQVTYSFTVSASRAGTFTLPSLQLGATITEPLTLEVGGSGSTQATAQSAVQTVRGPSARALAHLSVPKKTLFVGESERVTFKAYFAPATEVTITGQPTVAGGTFLLGDLSRKPKQTDEVIGGHPYTALTWSATLTAVKNGHVPLVASLPATLRFREDTERAIPSLFGDDDLFRAFDLSAFKAFSSGLGRVRQKDVILTTAPVATEVASLPAHAPPGFAGAVGQFQLDVRVAQTQASEGEPLTLRMEVSGNGNFDRVSAPSLPATADWKTYAATGRLADGHKVFEQAIVPLKAGPLSVPGATLSYFDPVRRKYVTARASIITVQVEPSVLGASKPSPPTSTLAVDPSAPNELSLGRVTSLTPLFKRPWFFPTTATPPFLLAGAALLIRRRRSRREQVLNDKRLHNAVVDMDRAAADNDCERFFRSARRALQCGLADLWHVTPDAITKSDIAARVDGDSEQLQSLFDIADSALYAGGSLDGDDLRAWQRRVRDQLRHLKTQASARHLEPARMEVRS